MNVALHNSKAWDVEAKNSGPWSQPVTREIIAAAKAGDWKVQLTATTPVPKNWFPNLQGIRLLALASGGGQQAPIFAAAGAKVTVFDNSKAQLDLDQFVADREGFNIKCEQGDMADLSRFPDKSFDLIFHPVSNCYVENLDAIWKESFRILSPRGALLSGFFNPFYFMLDYAQASIGVIKVRYRVPYSDLTSISEAERKDLFEKEGKTAALCFGHSLSDQIGGQTEAGFLIGGFYEDYLNPDISPLAASLNKLTPMYIATRAIKLE